MILAYDFGTGGIKASLFDAEGKVLASGFDAYETFYPASGFHEQAPEYWWRATVKATRLLVAELTPGQRAGIRAIGISGHSLGVVPLDAEGRLLRARVPIWSDSRADAEAREFFECLLRNRDDCAPGCRVDGHLSEPNTGDAIVPIASKARDLWYETTGCGFPPGLYSVFKLMWFKKHEPEWFNRVDVILGTKDYVNYRLTGVKATDNSYASGSGVYDLRKRVYSPAFIAASGLPASIFPRIVPSTQVLGTLTSEATAELGLPETVQVVAGGVDNSCMALGAGAYREGRAYASLGSSAWIAVSSSCPLIDERTRPYVFDHVVPGQYASALAIFSAGTSHTWLRDILGLDYAEMDKLAVEAGIGAHGLFFNPSLAGGSSLDRSPSIRGGFANLSLGHTRGDLVRAVMEGVAFGLKGAFDALAEQVPLAPPLALVGGGAKTHLWRQIYADVFGLAVARNPIGQQCAALGAAALAAVGTGIWRDFSPVDAAARAAGTASVETPDPDTVRTYAAAYRRFCALADHLADWSQEH